MLALAIGIFVVFYRTYLLAAAPPPGFVLGGRVQGACRALLGTISLLDTGTSNTVHVSRYY